MARDYDFIPLDLVTAPSPLGGGLIPSFSRTQSALDLVNRRGPGPVGAQAQARAVEDTMGVALGAALSGAAAAHGFQPIPVAIAGACVAIYGVMQGHPMLTNVGRGIVAPLVADMVREALSRRLDPVERPQPKEVAQAA